MSTPTPDAYCPRCRDTTLRRVRTRHGTLGYCPGCKGHHVTEEAGDFLAPLMARLAKRLTSAAGEGRCAQGIHLLVPEQEHCYVCPMPSLRCPDCTSRMVPLEVHGQTVDVCTLCPGMWLDANELTALRSAHQGQLAARDGSQVLTGSRPEESQSFLGTVGEVAGDGVIYIIIEAICSLF